MAVSAFSKYNIQRDGLLRTQVRLNPIRSVGEPIQANMGYGAGNALLDRSLDVLSISDPISSVLTLGKMHLRANLWVEQLADTWTLISNKGDILDVDPLAPSPTWILHRN